MLNFKLSRNDTALLIVDVQEALVPCMERGEDVLSTMHKLISAIQILQIPIVVSEQYPKGLGPTVCCLQNWLGKSYVPHEKSTFSCCGDPNFNQYLQQLPYHQWIVIGLEAHICVLQTAKDLLGSGKQVVVLNDAITSRSIYDFSTAIAEMRDCGIRVSSTETVIYELIADSKAPEFKQITQLVKQGCCCH